MGLPLLKYPLQRPVDAEIRQSVVVGMVSEFECRESARFCLYNWTEWLTLEDDERIMSVAYYRLHNALEANISDAHMKHMEMQQRMQHR